MFSVQTIPPDLVHSCLSCRKSFITVNRFISTTHRKIWKRIVVFQVGTEAKEARYWLKQFQQGSQPYSPFAIVQVERDVFDNPEMVSLASSSLVTWITCVCEGREESSYTSEREDVCTVVLWFVENKDGYILGRPLDCNAPLVNYWFISYGL